MTREEAKRFWLTRYKNAKDFSDPHWEAQERREHREYVEALRMAIEALLILGEDGIVNCCECIHWNEYGFCNLTDKHRKDFDYCCDGRREQ